MTYRVQVDLSFVDLKDANSFIAYVDTLKDKLYVPKETEVSDRPDLWVDNRLNLIKDYDDEGKNQGGVAYKHKLITPKVVEKVEKVVIGEEILFKEPVKEEEL